MYFIQSKENEGLIKRLENVIREDRVSHAYIFEGPSTVDKRSFSESFIKGILCEDNRGTNCGLCSICGKVDHHNHEDVIYIEASGNSIKDSAILDMQEQLKSKSFGNRHIVIIEQGDKMTERAQNRLLKTLEEPPGRSIIIILSENIENLVQTIQSRCVKYRINNFDIGYDEEINNKALKLVDMIFEREPFFKIIKHLESSIIGNEDAEAFLDALQVIYRNILVDYDKTIILYKKDTLIKNIQSIEKTRRQIRSGVSVNYALKHMILEIS